jgi:hypothetical protein
MRINALYLLITHARGRYEIVDDPNTGLGHNGQIEVQQVVVVLMYRAVQRVLDWNYGGVNLLLIERAEYVFEPLAGQNINPISE